MYHHLINPEINSGVPTSTLSTEQKFRMLTLYRNAIWIYLDTFFYGKEEFHFSFFAVSTRLQCKIPFHLSSLPSIIFTPAFTFSSTLASFQIPIDFYSSFLPSSYSIIYYSYHNDEKWWIPKFVPAFIPAFILNKII